MFNYILSKRWFFLRSETDFVLVTSMFFSVMLVLAGMIYTTYFVFLFLIWNLFLAYIPYAVSNWLQQNPGWIENKWKFATAFLVWLLFVPNSFYLVTDLFHLGQTYWVPSWFDLIVLMSFAWNGLLLGFISIRQMEKIMEVKIGSYALWKFTYPIILLNAFGVYIGRYLRYNSWDFVANPFQLFKDIAEMIVFPFNNLYAWGMIFCFSVFMLVVYMAFKFLGRMRW